MLYCPIFCFPDGRSVSLRLPGYRNHGEVGKGVFVTCQDGGHCAVLSDFLFP